MRIGGILIVVVNLMIMENHMEDSINVSIPKIKNAKEFLNAISKKFQSFQRMRKNFYLIIFIVLMFVLNLMSLMCNSMQAVISKRNPTSLEKNVYMGDNTRVKVDFMRVVRLQLSTGNFLELQDMVYIPSINRNSISVPILDRFGYSFLFLSRKVKLYRDSLLIGNGTLCGNLYRLELYSLLSISLAINIISQTKRLSLNEKSSILWHKRLSHIFSQRMERLIMDEILPDVDFLDFDTYVDCIKVKLIAKIRNAKADRCTELLGLFMQIFVGHSSLLLRVATNISSRSLMIIPDMVLLSSFVRSLKLWRLPKL